LEAAICVEKLGANMNLLNWIIGGIFVLAAISQLVKFYGIRRCRKT